jgi:hypothetical protein
MINTRAIDLTDEQREQLKEYIHEELSQALSVHRHREDRYAEFYRLYKSRPEQETKDFPWPGAANVVVPLVAVGVDSIAARLQRAIFGVENIVEVKIKNKEMENLEKPLRDYFDNYLRTVTAQELRTLFVDMPTYGHAIVKARWEKKTRTYHQYDADGNVLEQEIVDFENVRWHIIHPNDCVYPDGFESWKSLPWIAHRIRYTEAELQDLVEDNFITEESFEKLKSVQKGRTDKGFKAQAYEKKEPVPSKSRFFELYEIHGRFKVPAEGDKNKTRWEECIILYSHELEVMVKEIYNPYFGKARHFQQIPYLVQPHEIEAQGVAEQAGMFQESASTCFNQMLDAGTVGNAGLIVTTPTANFEGGPEVYPGKRIRTEDPSKDVRVVHLGNGSPVMGTGVQQSTQFAEKRTGVGAYQLGQESPIVGSQATATGTTALISEGNTRFWVSIDDMRLAIEELLYLTLSQIQQFAREGLKLPNGETLQLPQGDLRQILGLRLAITSETLNKELELRNIQMLVQMLNEYYQRIMEASAVLQNPQFPPLQKAVIVQVMNSAHDLMRRLVERFDMENSEIIVPNLMQTLAQTMGVLGGQTNMAGAAQGMAPGVPGMGAPQPPGPNGGMLGPGSPQGAMAGSALPQV